jgi:hypothetical protein
MSGLGRRLATIFLAGGLGVFAIVACSAEGSSSGELGADISPIEPAEPPGAKLPPSSSSSSGSGSGSSGDDAGGNDAATAKDASKDATPVDAGPPPPVPGTACSTIDEVRKKSCGACGQQEAICMPDKTWSIYSPCIGEIAGGCIPGTVLSDPCGNCGTQTRTCSQYCAFTTSTCAGQPVNSCSPGSLDLSGAGCATDTFRARTCQPSCTYNNFSATCGPAPSTIDIGPTVGAVNSTIAILTPARTMPRISGICPTAYLNTTIITPYTYLRVHNPLAKAAVVAIYNSLPAGGVAYRTILAAYDAEPTTDPERQACVKIGTSGTAALTGDSKYASLDGTKAVTIAAGATVVIYVGAVYAYDPTKPTESTGKVKLNAQTMSLL